MRRWLLCVALGLSLATFGQETWGVLVSPNDTWKYVAAPENPGNGWPELLFNDSGWHSGVGGMGYGDEDDGTQLTPTQAVFMRRKFILPAEKVVSLKLFADFDDGFIAYLNGTEIARFNMNPGSAGVEALASAGNEAFVYQGLEPMGFTLPVSLLQPGENVLAVQTHNVDPGSSDLSANYYLFAAFPKPTEYPTPPSWFSGTDEFIGSNLPIFMLETNGENIPDEPRITADLKVIWHPDGSMNYLWETPEHYNGKVGIEIRGESSQMFPKKSFSMETRQLNGTNFNVALLGLPPENDWILYAPYTDKTMLRDILAFELARDLGRYGSRWRFVELFINGSYEGVYVLLEKIKIDKNRVAIDPMEPTDNSTDGLTGGYILRVDKWDYTDYEPFTFQPGVDGLAPINFQYFDPQGEELTATQRAAIKERVTLVASALTRNPSINRFSQYINPASAIDFLLINELGKNIDAYLFSTYLYKAVDSSDPTFQLGPVWDFNLAFGNVDYSVNSQFAPGWIYEETHRMFWFRKLMQEPLFAGQLKCRWQELRAGRLNDTYFDHKIDSLISLLGPAIDRNYNRWPILGQYVWPNQFVGQTYAEEIGFLKQWIHDRVAWMDENIPGNCDLVTSVDEKDLDAELFPNPALQGKFSLKFHRPLEAGAQLEIYSTLGNRIYIKESGEILETEVTLSQPPGLYWVVVREGSRLRKFSVMVTK